MQVQVVNRLRKHVAQCWRRLTFLVPLSRTPFPSCHWVRRMLLGMVALKVPQKCGIGTHLPSPPPPSPPTLLPQCCITHSPSRSLSSTVCTLANSST